MKISSKAAFLLGTAIAIDAYTAGGFSITAIGIKQILDSIPSNLSGFLSGLSSSYASNAKFGKSSKIDDIFSKAITKTIDQIRDDFTQENDLKTSSWRNLSIKYGFSIPDIEENYTTRKSLENHFFNPLKKALSNESYIEEILNNHQEISPDEFLNKIIEGLNISLPNYQTRYSSLIQKALKEGFKNNFIINFNNLLLEDESILKVYQITLLQSSVSHLEKIGKIGEKNLDLINFHNLQVKNIHTSFEKLSKKIENIELNRNNSTLPLTLFEKKNKDVRDQFRFESNFLSFVGRNKELSILFDFLQDERKFLFYIITGRGGSGKSRLANELCIRSKNMGWYSGFLSLNNQTQIENIVQNVNNDSLIIIDYSKRRQDVVAEILIQFARAQNQGNLKNKIRVMAILRELDKESRDTLLTSQTRYHYYTFEENKIEKAIFLDELGQDDLWSIIEEVIVTQAAEELKPDLIANKNKIMSDLKKQDPYGRPLFAFFSGIALSEGEKLSKWNTNDNLTYHLERLEKKVWSQIPIWEEDNIKTGLKEILFLASICEFISKTDLLTLVEKEQYADFSKKMKEIGAWDQLLQLFTLAEGGVKIDSFLGIKPDILAEFYLAKLISDYSKNPFLTSKLKTLFEFAWEIRPEKVWWMTWLTFKDFNDDSNIHLKIYFDWLYNKKVSVSFEWFGKLMTNLGTHHLSISPRDTTGAEKWFRKTIEFGHIDGLYNLGKLHHELKKYDSAIKYYTEASNKGDAESLNGLGLVFKDKGDIEKAIYFYKNAIKEKYYYSYINLGNIYTDQGNFKDAIECYEAAISIGNIGAIFNLANLYIELNNFSKAEKYLLMAEEKEYPLAYNKLGILYGKMNDYEKSKKSFLKSIKLGHVEDYAYIGILYKEKGQLEKAIHWYEKGVKYNSQIAAFNLGLLYQERGEFEKAKKYFTIGVENNYAQSMNQLSIILKQEGELEKARELLERAISMGNNISWLNLGILLLETENFKDAEAAFFEAIKLGLNQGLFNLALLYEMNGDLIKAEYYYIKSIESNDERAFQNLFYMYNILGEYKKADDLKYKYRMQE